MTLLSISIRGILWMVFTVLVFSLYAVTDMNSEQNEHISVSISEEDTSYFIFDDDGITSYFGTKETKKIKPRGELEFILEWNFANSSHIEGPDIDMWIREPNGYVLSSSRVAFKLGPTPTGGTIDVDDMGGGGGGNGCGPERAFWPKGACPKGKYEYGVRYYGGTGDVELTMWIRVDGQMVERKNHRFSHKGPTIRLGIFDYNAYLKSLQ